MPDIVYCGPVIAEFGWEVMTIQPYFRAASEPFDKVYVCSFPGMEFLYADFCDVFLTHRHPGRALKWWDEEAMAKVEYEIPAGVTFHMKPVRQYRNDGRLFIPYGTKDPISTYNYIIHARNIQKGSVKNYNYDCWQEVVKMLDGNIASVGKYPDRHIPGTDDLRGVDGDVLVRYMAGARCVIGGSSGVMHLATLCNAPIVTWGDSRTYFYETLEKRYTETWNPFRSPVKFLFSDNWQPEPDVVVDAVVRIAKS